MLAQGYNWPKVGPNRWFGSPFSAFPILIPSPNDLFFYLKLYGLIAAFVQSLVPPPPLLLLRPPLLVSLICPCWKLLPNYSKVLPPPHHHHLPPPPPPVSYPRCSPSCKVSDKNNSRRSAVWPRSGRGIPPRHPLGCW